MGGTPEKLFFRLRAVKSKAYRKAAAQMVVERANIFGNRHFIVVENTSISGRISPA